MKIFICKLQKLIISIYFSSVLMLPNLSLGVCPK